MIYARVLLAASVYSILLLDGVSGREETSKEKN